MNMAAMAIRGLLFLFALLVLPGGAMAADAPASGLILGPETLVRYHACFGELPSKKSLTAANPGPARLWTPRLAGDWVANGIDDSGWERARTPLFDGSGAGISAQANVARLFARTTFVVSDLAKAKAQALKLECAFRGGAVAYLNGKELGRSHLAAGDPATIAWAEDYPESAWQYTDGTVFFGDGNSNPDWAKKVLAARQQRTRSVAFTLPADGLVAGRNVLAFEIVPAPPVEGYRSGEPNSFSTWISCGLDGLRLSGGDGILANNGPVSGLQVWNLRTLDRVAEGHLDHGEAGVAPSPMRISVPRNGIGSGCVAASDTKGIEGLKVSASPLLPKAGGKPLPAPQIRYGIMRPKSEQGMWRRAWHYDYINGLTETAPTGRLVPIWLTVGVPADAAPGDYSGSLEISCTGNAAQRVPVEIAVSPWLCPSPVDMVVRTDMVQSPDAVAAAYGVPLYSDRHFALMEKTFQLMGQYPSRFAWAPLIEESLPGVTQSMLRYGKKPDGTWQIDYSIFERYIDLQAKYCGAPKAIVFSVRGPGGDLKATRRTPNIDPAALPKPVFLTALDGKGKEQMINWTPEADAFWKQVFDGLRQRVVKRGWKEDIIMVGISSESQPSQRFVDMFKKAAPYARWMNLCHDNLRTIGGVPVGYNANVRGEGFWDGEGWANPRQSLHYGYSATYSTPPMQMYRYLESSLAGHYRGVGKLGADFWAVPGKERPEFWPGGQPTMKWSMSYPCAFMQGPDGAQHSMHSLLLRDSVQVCEAKSLVERALADPALQAKLEPALQERCRSILGQLNSALQLAERTYSNDYIGYGFGEVPARAAEVYDVASQVGKALGR